MSKPSIIVSMTPNVIFIGESALLSWDVANANEVSRGMSINHTGLLADPTSISGTKIDGSMFGGGGAPPGAFGFKGQETIDKNNQGMYTPSWQNWGFTAQDSFGNSATKYVNLNILSEPNYSGKVTPQRKDTIKNALRDITKRIMSGSIYWDTQLDTKIAAFQKNLITRAQLWGNLRNVLFNLHLLTFNCIETKAGDQNFGGVCIDYSNEIKLEFPTTYNPYYEYIILHELVHKCGFNGALLYKGPFSHSEIETQACRIACAVYSDCAICDCCLATQDPVTKQWDCKP